MNRKRVLQISAAVSAIVLALGAGIVVSQNAPTETKGVKVSPPTATLARMPATDSTAKMGKRTP